MKSKGIMQNFIKSFVWILVSLEIVLGIIWMISNWGLLIPYGETVDLTDAAITGVLDEYTAVLYPLFLKIFMGTAGSELHYKFVYLIQLLLLLGTSFYMLTGFRNRINKRKALLGSLIIVTIPMVAQCILMIAPFTFSISLIFLCAGAVVRLFGIDDSKKYDKNDKYPLFVLLGSILLAGLNSIDVFWVLCITMAIIFIFKLLSRKTTQKGKFFLFKVVPILVIFVITFGLFQVSTETGSRGRVQKTASAALWERTTWPYFGKDYFEMPYDVRLVFTGTEMSENIYDAETFIYRYGPVLDETYGLRHANALYREMSLIEMKMRTKELVSRIGSDFAGYLFMPFSLIPYMNGTSGSISGLLYARMSGGTTGILYLYWETEFLCVCSCGLIMLLKTAGKGMKKKTEGTGSHGMVWMCSVYLLVQSLYYTVFAPQGVDYRNVITGLVFWHLAVLYGCLNNRKGLEREADND